MITIQDTEYPTVLRKNCGLLIPYVLDHITDKDEDGNAFDRYTFYYCLADDDGQDLSNASIIDSLIGAVKIIQGSASARTTEIQFLPIESVGSKNYETKIFYIVTHQDNITNRNGQVVTLRLKQDNNGAYLDFLWNDCIQIYPRPGQPEDPEKVVIKMRIGSKYQQFLADQCGSDNPFYDSDAVAILDVYNQFFVSLETLKEAYQDLAGTIEMECVNEEGITQTKTIPIMDEEHKWAGDF